MSSYGAVREMRIRGKVFTGLLFLFLAATGCAKNKASDEEVSQRNLPAARLIRGTYQPDPTIIGSPVIKGSVQVTSRTLYYSNVGMVRFNDAWSNKQITVDLGDFDRATDFGNNGSITLTAETKNYPLNGGAYPVLTEFSVESGGVTTNYINLTPGCASSGMWVCNGGSCYANASCTVQNTSHFANRIDWDQHQLPPFGFVTTNAFPRCDGSVGSWNCPTSGGLPSGRYRAKYLLLSNSGSPVDTKLADLSVQVMVRKDTGNGGEPSKGGVNVNLILVGDKNVNDSHTSKGARNLNLLFQELNRIFKTESGANMGLNQIKVYEWRNADGGSRYSQVDLDALGDLFESGSKGLDPADNGKFVNLFLVSDIVYSGAYTILGLSGGILGPPVNGTQTSGLAFSSFDQLASFNPKASCGTTDCPRFRQEADFLEMGATIAHEIGHYLGLNHPSERPDATHFQDHDPLSDTPTCKHRLENSTVAVLDNRACYRFDLEAQPAPLGGISCKTACDQVTGTGTPYLGTGKSSALIDGGPSFNQPGYYSGTTATNGDMPQVFCPAVAQCQFNHVMWYTTKNRRLVPAGHSNASWAEDGNLFSTQSQSVMMWSPLVR
jgi:hypothetical protein